MGEVIRNGIIVPTEFIDFSSKPWLIDPNYVIPNILLFGITMVLCCTGVWLAENRSEQIINRFIMSWLNPIINKIKGRREYVVQRNKTKAKLKAKRNR
jgi:hypothetical protein